MIDKIFNDITAQNPSQTVEEGTLVVNLLELSDDKNFPWRKDFESTITTCYNFKELRQWDGLDAAILEKLDVPAIAVDRLDRGISTIKGIRLNTGVKKRVVKRELGDKRVAELLDKVMDYVSYRGALEDISSESFDDLCDIGIGIRKLGFDPESGDGEIWFEKCNIEELRWSGGKRKTLEDATLLIHTQMMAWEDAVMLNPDKAPVLKGIRQELESKWDSLRTNSKEVSASVGKDYGVEFFDKDGACYKYPDQVYVSEFWIQRKLPVKQVLKVTGQSLQSPDGMSVEIPKPEIVNEPLDYQPQENEKIVKTTVIKEWYQFIVAHGKDKKHGILLRTAKSDDHPFVAECAERKRSGAPIGYIERVKDHQVRINIAYAQKMAYNNKSIKSPLITKGQEYDIEKAVQQSSFGALFHLPMGTEVVSINTVPQVNLQSIEEGALARQDMDFAASATEPALRGQVQNSTSGIQLAYQQNAAVTPLNKWVSAEKSADLVLYRKALNLVIKHFSMEKIMRIVGEEEFLKLMQPKVDPMTGQILEKGLQLPLDISLTNYDIEIVDQSINDAIKQQSFNAIEALVSGGVPMTDDFRIQNAPIRNVDDALKSNQEARNDILKQMMFQIQMMSEQIGSLEKKIPKQERNAVTGKNAPQAGTRSMLGGAGKGKV